MPSGHSLNQLPIVGWVIIGGLLSSLLLSRVVTPVLYSLLPPRAR